MPSQRKWMWTVQQEESLRQIYPHHSDEATARGIGCTPNQVRRKAKQMGLRKSPQYLEQLYALNAEQCRHTRFTPGHQSHNKGQRRPGFSPGRMRETQFKKGQRTGRANANYKPVGTEVVRSDGYLWRKVNEDRPFHRRWKEVHRIVWESVHGDVPAGHVVAFKGERTTDTDEITIDRLELITMAENARRNRMWTLYPREVCEVIHKRGQLVRRIRRLEREQ